MVRVYTNYRMLDYVEKDFDIPLDIDNLDDFRDYLSELPNRKLGIPGDADFLSIDIELSEFEDELRDRKQEQAEEEEWEEL